MAYLWHWKNLFVWKLAKDLEYALVTPIFNSQLRLCFLWMCISFLFSVSSLYSSSIGYVFVFCDQQTWWFGCNLIVNPYWYAICLLWKLVSSEFISWNSFTGRYNRSIYLHVCLLPNFIGIFSLIFGLLSIFVATLFDLSILQYKLISDIYYI